jgi:hypothetical protein
MGRHRWDHHPPCPGGCGNLADECGCPRPNPLGSMRIVPAEPMPSPADDDLEPLVALLREFADWDAMPRLGYLEPL